MAPKPAIPQQKLQNQPKAQQQPKASPSQQPPAKPPDNSPDKPSNNPNHPPNCSPELEPLSQPTPIDIDNLPEEPEIGITIDTPEKAIKYICNATIQLKSIPPMSSEQLCNALREYLSKLTKDP